MNQKEAAVRASKLREQINDYRYHYHVLDQSVMSEAAADSLKHELSALEEQFPEIITPDSPTQRVAGKPSSKFESVTHSRPMLSLSDVFSREEVEAWVKRCEKQLGSTIDEFYVELKMDGLAASLIYEDGVLAKGLTRGDGKTGEDVTANIRTVESVPLRLRRMSAESRVEVRGEVVLFKEDFNKLNAARKLAGQPLFANPRNTAAGTIRQLDPRLVAERRLSFIAYGLGDRLAGASTHEDEHSIMKELGFPVEPHSRVVKGIEEIMVFAAEWEEKRKTLPFGTDGMVITVNDNNAYARLGVVGKAPRGSVAYKFAAEQATTKLLDIQVSIGRTGAATPFAVLEPTLVAGSTIRMATLHNAGEIARKDIRVGDTVIIQKAGDVIPEVVQSLPKLRTGKEKTFVMPTRCPVCGTKLEKSEAEAIWRCPNSSCFALERGRIIHFASKTAFDIDGLGEKVVDQLLESKLISTPADLFKLTVGDIAGMPRFAQKSAENLVAAIATRKQVTLDRFIFGLGIRHVGSQTAADLAANFGSIEKFQNSTEAELNQIEGIGEVVSTSISQWLRQEANKQLLHELQAADVNPTPIKKVTGPLTGKSFVVTGTLESGSREQAEEQIKAQGGVAQSSVTKDTNYLVVGADPGASKLEKAKKYGTTQITEQELQRLLT